MPDNNAGAGLGLTDAEYNTYFGDGGTGSGNTSTGSSTNWLNSLATLAGAGANAYRSATGTQPKPTNNLLPIILIGAVGLVLVLVLALRR